MSNFLKILAPDGQTIATLAKPQLSYPSLEDAIKCYSGYAFRCKQAPEVFPCLSCRGEGTYKKFEDRDEIEGYKLAPRYNCESCEGTGIGPKEVFLSYIESQNQESKDKIAKFENDVHTLTAAIRKLSSEELDVFRNMLFKNQISSYRSEGKIQTVKVKYTTNKH